MELVGVSDCLRASVVYQKRFLSRFQLDSEIPL